MYENKGKKKNAQIANQTQSEVENRKKKRLPRSIDHEEKGIGRQRRNEERLTNKQQQKNYV